MHERYLKNKELFLSRSRATHRKVATEAKRRVAEFWGDKEPKCRFELISTNNGIRNPERICFGNLEIDHIYGYGSQERKKITPMMRYRQIIRGEYPLHEIRILCKLHQLWNQG